MTGGSRLAGAPASGRLDGLVALVTGAGRGIGAAVAVRLARDGAAVGVNVRSREKADETLAAIAGFGGRAVALVGDVAEEDDVRRIVAECVEHFGGLSVAVNNAGTQEESPFLELELSAWRRQMAVDLDGVFLVGREAARHMAGHGGGVIVNVTSVHEHTTFPGFTAYCAAKAGAGMLTRNMARELAPHGIRVVAVAPGAVTTGDNAELLDDPEEREKALAGIPAGRMAEPAEIAALVSFLASPEAAYITGTSVVIDGGLELQVSET